MAFLPRILDILANDLYLNIWLSLLTAFIDQGWQLVDEVFLGIGVVLDMGVDDEGA
jgi:hypothetical protein